MMRYVIILFLYFFTSQLLAGGERCSRKTENFVLHEYGLHKETLRYRRNCTLSFLELKHFNKYGEKHFKIQINFRRNGNRRNVRYIINHMVFKELYYNRHGELITVVEYP
ncbi:MAG: hypothetical protein JJU02_06160 [Cryomorphaceae bacterium]|nr:hypothetical protein [Cryomorphaceae bacterium]